MKLQEFFCRAPRSEFRIEEVRLPSLGESVNIYVGFRSLKCNVSSGPSYLGLNRAHRQQKDIVAAKSKAIED